MLFEEPERHLNFLFDQVSVRKKEKPNGNSLASSHHINAIIGHHLFGAVNNNQAITPGNMTQEQHEI